MAEARRALQARKASLSADNEAARAELLELDAALARLDASTWGRCEHCGGAIGRTRLRALPEARLCLPCSRT
jgi:RNA polymerase-binding transcription factor DksA